MSETVLRSYVAAELKRQRAELDLEIDAIHKILADSLTALQWLTDRVKALRVDVDQLKEHPDEQDPRRDDWKACDAASEAEITPEAGAIVLPFNEGREGLKVPEGEKDR